MSHLYGSACGAGTVLSVHHPRARARSGKTVPTYQPSMDMGSYVVIVNAEKVIVTGNKANLKIYTRHTGRPGSRKEETFAKLQAVRCAAARAARRARRPSARCRAGIGAALPLYKLNVWRWSAHGRVRAQTVHYCMCWLSAQRSAASCSLRAVCLEAASAALCGTAGRVRQQGAAAGGAHLAAGAPACMHGSRGWTRGVRGAVRRACRRPPRGSVLARCAAG